MLSVTELTRCKRKRSWPILKCHVSKKLGGGRKLMKTHMKLTDFRVEVLTRELLDKKQNFETIKRCFEVAWTVT
jgi:hypothetical protein